MGSLEFQRAELSKILCPQEIDFSLNSLTIALNLTLQRGLEQLKHFSIDGFNNLNSLSKSKETKHFHQKHKKDQIHSKFSCQ